VGIRIEAYAVDVPKLAELLNATIGDLLRRYQLDGKHPEQRLMFTDLHNDDIFLTTPGGPIRASIGNGSDRHFEELNEERLRTLESLRRPAHEHLSRDTIFGANRLLRGLSRCKGIDFIEPLIDGHRRWWIGSLLQFAHKHFEPGEYEQLELLFRRILRRLDCGYKIQEGDPGLVATGLPFTPEDNLDLPFGRWSEAECFEAVPLLSKIMELSPTFTRPPGPIGIAPDDSEWHEWVCNNVKSLLRIKDLGYSTCNLLTFIG